LVLGEYEYASVQPAAMRDERLWPEDDLKRDRLQAPPKREPDTTQIGENVVAPQRLLLGG